MLRRYAAWVGFCWRPPRGFASLHPWLFKLRRFAAVGRIEHRLAGSVESERKREVFPLLPSTCGKRTYCPLSAAFEEPRADPFLPLGGSSTPLISMEPSLWTVNEIVLYL